MVNRKAMMMWPPGGFILYEDALVSPHWAAVVQMDADEGSGWHVVEWERRSEIRLLWWLEVAHEQQDRPLSTSVPSPR